MAAYTRVTPKMSAQASINDTGGLRAQFGTERFLVQHVRRGVPEEPQENLVTAKCESHARDIVSQVFPDSDILKIQRQTQSRSAAFPDARFIDGEFRAVAIPK